MSWYGGDQKPLLPDSNNPFNAPFSDLVLRTLEHFHVPGISVSVVHDEEIFAIGYGTAKYPDVKAKPETLYFAGSTTKSFTAAVLTMIMDDQASSNISKPLTWTTPLSTILRDDFVLHDDYITAHATLEDAASHRTGLGGHDLSYGGSGTTVRDVVRSLRHLPFSTEFRTTFQYNNMMWTALQHLAEKVTGQWLGNLLQTRLWEPLEMTRTYLTIDQAKQAVEMDGVELAQGYFWDNKTDTQMSVPYYNIDEVAGCGAIISSVLDYAKYLKMMIHETRPISPKGHMELRQARSIVQPGRHDPLVGRVTYALGWGVFVYHGVEVMQHSGGLPGFGTFMAFVPSKKWGVTLMGNAAEPANHANSVLFFSLLDDLLHIPDDRRTDFTAIFDKTDALSAASVIAAKSKIYPSIPSPPLPHSLPLSSYSGNYANPGYQNLTFHLTSPSARIPGSSNIKIILRANATHRTWPHAFELEHVTGEHFLGWLISKQTDTEEGPGSSGIDNANVAFPAEFIIAPDGQPQKLGMALEPTMDNYEKIWFERVEDSR